MLDRFVLWWCRTWVLWGLALSLVFIAVPIKTYQVCFEAMTGEALWTALAQDMDVGESVKDQAEQVMNLVPVEELQTLEPMLGPERTKEIVAEAEVIRGGVARASRSTRSSARVCPGSCSTQMVLGRTSSKTYSLTCARSGRIWKTGSPRPGGSSWTR